MKTSTTKIFTLLICCLCWSTLSYGQFVTETAGTTTTVMPADGEIFTDPSDGTNGGPGGDCTTTSSGNLGDYPNCGCITATTLCAPAGAQISVTFTSFRVNGAFDWMSIFDGSGPVTATNGGGTATNPSSGDPELWSSVADGDELIDMTNAGSVTFTSTNGCLTFAARFSTVVNTCGWEAGITIIGGAPPGDDCVDAVPLPVQSAICTTQLMGDNSASTPSGDGAPSCGNFATGEDNWFTLTVPATGELNIEMSSAVGPTDWAMSAYSGACGALTEIECDDDDGPGLFPTLNLTGLTPGDPIFVQVWEWGNNATGAFNICANDNSPPPAIPNDACAMATPLNVDAAAMCLTQTLGSNVDATASGETPAPSCGAFATGEDVWYSLLVPASGNLNIEMSGAGGPTDWAMSAYSGTCGALTEIECDDDDGPGLFPTLNLMGQAPGSTILVRVWEWNNNAEGQFNICAFSPPCDVNVTGIASTDESCFEASDGTITITATTSNGPLTYDIAGPVNMSNATGIFTGLPPGSYSFTVTDTGVPPPCAVTGGPITIGTDVTPPVITCPPSTFVPCDDIPSPAASLAEFVAMGGTTADACAIASVTASDVSVGTVCPNTAQRSITRTYTVSDDSGNPSTCTQTITVLNSVIGPIITAIPLNQTVDCSFNAMPQLHLFQADTECGLGLTLSVGDVVVSGTPNCPGAQYRYTYSALDACGRLAEHTQIYTIQNDAPELVLPPEICIIECPNDPAMIINSFNAYAEVATVITSCNGIGTTITNNFNPNGFFNQNCNAGPINGIDNVRQWQQVTFTATDPCGRTSTGSILVVVVDNTAPTIVGEPYLTIRECDDLVQSQYDAWIADNLANMTATDACSDVTWSHSPASPNEGPWVAGYAITHVIFTATDDCGNSASKDIHFKLKNNHPPTFIGDLPDLTAECSDPMPNFETPTFIHACGATTLTFADVTTPGACPQEFSVTRTWTVTDNCEGVNTTSQTIYIVDTTAPEFTSVPASSTVECADDIVFGTATATDNCGTATITTADMSGVTVLGSLSGDQENPPSGSDATGSLIGGYDAVSGDLFLSVTYDNLSAAATGAHIHNAPTGSNGGVIINFNTLGFVSGETSGSFVAVTTLTDEQVTELEAGNLYVNIHTSTVPSGEIRGQLAVVSCGTAMKRVFTATDECGNASTAVQVINSNDTTDPVAPMAPDPVTVQCADDVPVGMDLTAVDNCDGDITVSPVDDTTPGACADQFTVVRTWTFTDACGNESSVSQTITVNDDTAPVFTDVPTGGTVECADDVVFDEPTVTDNCSDVMLTSSDVTTGDDCSGSVTRTWTATDACGNASMASATISYSDTQAPVASNVPADETINCTDPVVFGADPTWTDNCDDDVFSSFEDVTTPGDCEGSYTVERFWTAIDECNNTAVVSQTITVVDDTAPMFTSVPSDGTQECGNDPQFGTPTATDDCGTVTITHEDETTGGCAGSVTRTWTATDDCGNTATASATITFSDDEPPVFTNVPETPDVNCDNIPDWEIPEVEDNCGEVTLTFVESISGDLCDDGYAWKRDWTATDACGNTATVETVIWVNPDNDGPVFTFVPEGALINCDEFPPTFGTPEVEDACGEVTLTSIVEYVTGGPNSCDNGESFDYRTVWTATDACGNETTAKQTFWVKPTNSVTGTISGNIATEENDMVEEVEVTVDGAGLNSSLLTSGEGYFEFGVPVDFNYEVTPYLNADPMNGVSTMDLIMISKHILGMELLDSPYKLIAADINNSGNLSGFDLVELRKMILYINTEFPDNTSWRFVEDLYAFPNPTNPWMSTFPEMVSINGMTASEVADFIAIKVGDVNGTVVANQLTGGDTRDELEELTFQVDNQQLESGEMVQVAFTAKDFKAIHGYQFTLNFDPTALEFVDVEKGALAALSSDNFGFSQLDNGAITSSWNSRSAIDLNDDAILFSLTFKAKTNRQLSEVLSLNSRFTQAEAYNENAVQMDLSLVFNTENGLEVANEFALYQNRPNPFKAVSVIGFVLPEAGAATLSIYDVSGRVLRTIEGDYAKGYNELSISRSELSSGGVLYYQLDTPTHSATKKMIVIE